MVKVSVIVPVYNVEKFLRKCLDSLINQTLTDIEIICIDDESPDNSIQILNEYEKKDNRIKVISQKNQGLSGARNTGMKIAQGEYLSFVDSDDWIDKDFLEKLYNAAKKHDADIAVGGIKRIRPLKWKFHLRHKNEEVTEDTDKKFELCDVPTKSYVWNKIYKKSEMEKHNLTFEVGRHFEDKIFSPQALYYLKKLVTVPNTYYNYWTNPNSIIKTRSEKNDRDSAYAAQYLNKFVQEHNINIDHHYLYEKKYKFLGLTYLKIIEWKSKKKYFILNFIRFEIKK